MRVFQTKRQLTGFFLQGAKRYFLLSACFAVMVSLTDMLSPKLISFLVDSVIGNVPARLPGPLFSLLDYAGGIAGLRERPLILAAAVGVVGLLGAVFRYFFRACNTRGAETLMLRMRRELFGHILKLPLSWMEENSTGDVIQRCTSDAQVIRQFVSEQMTSLVRITILIVMALWFMAGINVHLTVLSAAFIPVIIGYSLTFYLKIGDAFQKADIEEGKLSAITQENLTGVRIVRAFGREAAEKARFEQQNIRYTNYWVRLIRLLSIFWCCGDVLTGLQVLSVDILGSVLCVRGTLTAGEFIAMVSYTILLAWPVRQLGRVISEMSKAGISIDRLRYIMNAEPENPVEGQEMETDGRTGEDGTADERIFRGDIVFDHVSFTYPRGTQPVLSDVSFRIPGGSVLGILGGAGSGKSTLALLLERMYRLPEDGGRVLIGGRDIRTIPLKDLRTHLGLVLQEPYLFSRSIGENIGMTAKETEKEEQLREDVARAAAIAHVDQAVADFPEGYRTFVGERGVTLSGGQKQRTAIAQMLYRDPPVMIFDDSLSSVDARTDQQIRESLRENTAGSTVIYISHRVATLMHADHIIVLDHGKIAEQGTHAQLVERGGLYSRVYALQTAAGPEEQGEGAKAERTGWEKQPEGSKEAGKRP